MSEYSLALWVAYLCGGVQIPKLVLILEHMKSRHDFYKNSEYEFDQTMAAHFKVAVSSIEEQIVFNGAAMLMGLGK
jgi:hypothetical protein